MDTVKNHLKLISSITPGYTLSVKQKAIVPHQGLISAVKRKWNREDRENCMNFISSTIECSISNLTSDLGILPLLKESRSGLLALKETYRDDTDIHQKIDHLLLRIDSAVTRFESRILTSIEQIPSLLAFLQSQVNAHEGLALIRQTPIASGKPSPIGTTIHSSNVRSSPRLSSPPVSASPLPMTPPSSPTPDRMINIGLVFPSQMMPMVPFRRNLMGPLYPQRLTGYTYGRPLLNMMESVD